MTLDPQSQAVLNLLNGSGLLPLNQFEPVEARKRLAASRAPRPAVPTHPMHSVSEETITTPDGSFRVRILHPRELKPGETSGGVIYLHGGGFVAGGIDETDLIVRQIAFQSDVVVVNVDYHLSPEAKFPVAVNDAYATLLWVVEHATRLGIDPGRIVLAGDSAGGNLTIVTCLFARERGGPAICLQVPIYPSLDLRPTARSASRTQWGGGGYFLSNDDIAWMRDQYFTTPDEGDDWRASPITAKNFTGLPPALVVTAGHDPLVDEGKLYADRLAADGVKTEYVCFDGTIHGFVSFASVLEVGARGMNLICDRISDATRKPA